MISVEKVREAVEKAVIAASARAGGDWLIEVDGAEVQFRPREDGEVRVTQVDDQDNEVVTRLRIKVEVIAVISNGVH